LGPQHTTTNRLRFQGVIILSIRRARNNKFSLTIRTGEEIFAKVSVFFQAADRVAIGAKCCFSAKLAVAGNLRLREDFCAALASNTDSIPVL